MPISKKTSMSQKSAVAPSTLYLVATPIGNMDDISIRAQQVLAQVDVVFAEDTRHTKSLLNHLNIDAQTVSLHEHNERDRVSALIERLEQGGSVALVSDAGTPAISDPGFIAVRAVREAGFAVSPIPGACALISALSVSGLATDAFLFDGFLPSKQNARQQAYARYANESRTAIVYESSHRIKASIEDLITELGWERRICVARELTKLFETVHTGTAQEVLDKIQADANQTKGEFVVLIEGVKGVEQTDEAITQVLYPLLDDLPLKQAAQLTARITGCKVKYAYNLGVDYKNN